MSQPSLTCPKCKLTFFSPAQLEAIRDWGECLDCDHNEYESKLVMEDCDVSSLSGKQIRGA